MSVQEAPEGQALEARPVEPIAEISFAQKLAGYFVAERGFRPGFPPEAAPLAGPADIILTAFTGHYLEIVCIVDGERHPGKVMALTAAELREIALANLKNSSSSPIFRIRHPVRISVIEVTDDFHSAARYDALAPLFKNGIWEKARLEVCVVDPVLNNCHATNRDMLRFVNSVMTQPALSIAQIQSAVAARAMPRVRAYVTYGLLALLAVCFLCEYVLNIGPLGQLGAPSIATLVSLGGIKPPLILTDHEWYRLWMAVLLHIDIGHIAMNGIALFLAGRMLEPMIGRIHFLALFVIGGLCGSLASTLWNAPTLVSVGASGAITGCFAAVMLLAFRFPPGALRTQIWRSSIYILVPAVLPFLNFQKGLNIDYADHIGGIIGGFLYSGLLFAVWPKQQLHPGLRLVSILMIAVGAAGPVVGVAALSRSYSENVQLVALSAGLAKDADVQPLWTSAIKGSDQFTVSYPSDPRGHVARGVYFLDTQHPDSAEAEARLALDQKLTLDKLMPPAVRQQAIGVLALAENHQGRTDEAKATAKPVCAATFVFQRFLVQEGLCPADTPPQ